jgi:hypothetical protein
LSVDSQTKYQRALSSLGSYGIVFIKEFRTRLDLRDRLRDYSDNVGRCDQDSKYLLGFGSTERIHFFPKTQL